VARLVHYILGPQFAIWLLAYADDGWFTGRGPHAYDALALVLLLFSALGVPISWKKLRGGVQIDWVGYWLDVGKFSMGISSHRQAWIIKWLTEKL
jgi:hypothetical protein